MRRGLLIAVALLLISSRARAQKLGPVDWIFLVDTSKSMRGVGGTKDIFGDVKASIDSFVREANDGDTVTIFTFDRDVTTRANMDLRGAAREDLYDAIGKLEAEGNRTHLGAAIAKGLERAEFLRANSDPTRARAVVLFTDGKEDVRGIPNPTHIDANLAGTADSFVFFVSMGKEHEPQLDEFAAKTPHASVLRAPTPEAIRAVAKQIRAKLPEPPPPPPPVKVKPAPPIPRPPPPSPWMRALRWLIALAILAGIAIVFLQQQRKKNRLEGEIEILRPQTAPDLAFVGLPKLQASEVMLSAILPLDALSGGDARLFVKRKDGKKKVWISVLSGGLRINDVDTPTSELYDADTIEIGTAKLRFNRVGDERPFDIDSVH
jgi:von Willebrand factor type A domain-containing protein